MRHHLAVARLAVKYRRKNRTLRRALALCQNELMQTRVTNYRLSATVARMDTVNSQLAHASAARDFRPAGGFRPWEDGESTFRRGQFPEAQDVSTKPPVRG